MDSSFGLILACSHERRDFCQKRRNFEVRGGERRGGLWGKRRACGDMSEKTTRARGRKGRFLWRKGAVLSP